MAKGQKRSNREIKKPKAKKAASGETISILSPKNLATQKTLPTKKG